MTRPPGVEGPSTRSDWADEGDAPAGAKREKRVGVVGEELVADEGEARGGGVASASISGAESTADCAEEETGGRVGVAGG